MTPEIQRLLASTGRKAIYWCLGSDCVVVIVSNYNLATVFTR